MCEPTGPFAPFKDAATAQHSASVFAAHKRRLNGLRQRLGSLVCFPPQQICGVEIPLPDGSFFKLFDFLYRSLEEPPPLVREEEFAKQLRLARYLAGASLGRSRGSGKVSQREREA